MTTKLSDTQRVLLERAILDNGGRITSDLIKSTIPHVKGGAASRVMTALGNQGLVAYDADGCYVTPQAGHLLFPETPCIAEHGPNGACPACAIDPDTKVDSGPSEPTTDSAPARVRQPRENSKQAEVIRMLQRPEGATIDQICAETSWQVHTARGFLAGAVKKKLGLALSSEKLPGAQRVYRVA